MLNHISLGDPSLPPMLFAHGLYGQARNWGMITRKLQDMRQCISVDMRNHGASDWSSDHGYGDMAADLLEVIESQGDAADVLGHSMGGKAAMTLALSKPQSVRKLIVADIAPVPYDHDQMQVLNAMRALDLTHIARRQDAVAGLMQQGLDQATAGFLAQSLDLASKSWNINLEALAQNMPGIMDFPQFHTSFDGPSLFLAGANSPYIRPEHHPAIRKHFPAAEIVTIADAGHWLHAEQPDAVATAIREFLAS